jgi:SAM-dependent methyltransferase
MAAKLRGQLAHSSLRAYKFRLNYIMRPLQKLACLTPWADESALAEYFRRLAQIYQHWLSGKSILDIGCGPGHPSNAFINTHGARSYTGVDFSATMIKDAKNIYPDIAFLAADTVNLPFQNGSFDIVHSTRLFHHLLPDKRAAVILEQLRVAKQALIIEDLFGFEPGFWKAAAPSLLHNF